MYKISDVQFQDDEIKKILRHFEVKESKNNYVGIENLGFDYSKGEMYVFFDGKEIGTIERESSEKREFYITHIVDSENYEPSITFTVSDELFEIINDCPDCHGEGLKEVIRCSKPASECCGGCVEHVDCNCEDKPYKD